MKDRTHAIVDGAIAILWTFNAARSVEPWMRWVFAFFAAFWGFIAGMYLAKHLLTKTFERSAAIDAQLIANLTAMVGMKNEERIREAK